MIFEEPPIFCTDFISPIELLVQPPEEPGDVTSIEYSKTGLVVVGAGQSSNGLMMMVSDAQGSILGVAFGDGDGNWDNEWEAMQSGVLCATGISATVLTSGAIAVVTGIATAAACADFIWDMGPLSNEYQTPTQNYSQSVTVFLNPTNQWDGAYVYTYPDGSSWTIPYDSDTQTYGEWVWKTGPL